MEVGSDHYHRNMPVRSTRTTPTAPWVAAVTDDLKPLTLWAALAQLQANLPQVRKNRTANTGHFSYTYADLADITAALFPAMAKLGLSFTATPTMYEGAFVLAYQLGHTSGENVRGWYPLPAQGSPQQVGSAITYARRYTLCAVTGLVADDDDDGRAAQTAPIRTAQDSALEELAAVCITKNMDRTEVAQEFAQVYGRDIRTAPAETIRAFTENLRYE